MRVPKIYSVVVNSVNITDAIFSSIISLNFTDVFASGASLVDFEVLSNAPSLPTLNQFIEIKFGYQDSPSQLVNTGTMRIDNVVEGFRPNTIKFGAIAWEKPSEGWSEGYSYGYQNFPLRNAIDNSATALGLTLNPLPNPLPNDLIIGTTSTLSASSNNSVVVNSQRGRYRLLDDIARAYGYLFQVKGGTLLFQRLTEVRARPAVSTIPLGAIMPGATFRSNTANQVKTVDITTKSGTTTTYTDPNVPSSVNTKVKLPDYYENLTATSARAAGFFAERNSDRLTATIKFAGSILYQAAQTVNLSGFKSDYNKKYLISRVVHDYGAQGWTTQLDLQIIG